MWMKLDYGYVNYIRTCMKCTVNVQARLQVFFMRVGHIVPFQ